MTTGKPRKLASVPPAGPGPVPRMSEAQLQQAVLDLARWLKLYAYHTRDSRRSAKGFPDLVIAGPGGLIFRELKTDSGTWTIDQKAWGHALVVARADFDTWRPADWHAGRIRLQLEALAAAGGMP